MRNRVDELLDELAAIEQQQAQSHSDQQLLDQAWEDLTDQIAFLQEAIEMGEEMEYEEQQEEEEDAPDWGGEQFPVSTTIQKVYLVDGELHIPQEELDRINELKDERVAADYYESDYGVYYNAADEV